MPAATPYRARAAALDPSKLAKHHDSPTRTRCGLASNKAPLIASSFEERETAAARAADPVSTTALNADAERVRALCVIRNSPDRDGTDADNRPAAEMIIGAASPA